MALKLNVDVKSTAIYLTIVTVIALIFFIGTYLVVDKYELLSGTVYNVIAYISLGVVKYILLLVYWKGHR